MRGMENRELVSVDYEFKNFNEEGKERVVC